MFRPPIVRTASAALDRALFSKTIPTAAARVASVKNLSKFRQVLDKSKELMRLERIHNVRADPDSFLAGKGGKCLLLRPEVKPEDPSTWSDALREAVKAEDVGVIPYDLKLDYNYWTYHDVMTSLLPEDAQGEIPVGFAIVGHVAHLNLRDEYLPYKKVIAEVLVDKNPTIRTVINKVDDVGTHSEFRTFEYEVLAGPDDMEVEMSEGDCIFKFNYSKVYWNSRLQTEHKRLVDYFQPGEVVCDVMAGIGPFAVPAGKKGVFVWANDLNPESYEALKAAIKRNKVQNFVRPFCADGHKFIYTAADDLIDLTITSKNTISIPSKARRSRSAPIIPPPCPTILTIPQTINHFVMNLPATAIDFVGSFNGLYKGHEDLFEPKTDKKLPMVHVHCFSTKSEDNVKEGKEICERISGVLGFEVRPRSTAGEGEEEEGEVQICEVRDVAPKKRMFCASFRIPRSVAFGERRNA
ncbi:probable protein MET-10 [Rhynchosporium secalis]|uniref:tRNA (guanine(37)-N1)-methyltransferase n=1 Tax=Rhynchosporium secalis TaxID=38038 RepID=A0A1E1LZH0_RHYSE|nr:probable protein MET-10 [Rhynchosporium secalis]